MLKIEKLYKKLSPIDDMTGKGSNGTQEVPYEELYPEMAERRGMPYLGKRYGHCDDRRGTYGVRVPVVTNIHFLEAFPGNFFKHEKELDPKVLAEFDREGERLGLSVSLQKTGDGRYNYVEVSKQGYPASENAGVVEQVEFLAKGIENAFKAQHE